MSSLSIFETTSDHDVIYSLLALAKDANPVASDEKFGRLSDSSHPILEAFLPNKQYIIEYQKPFVDVAGNFISFCIKQSTFTDKTRALDILCRPWAPEQVSRNRSLAKESKGTKSEPLHSQQEFPLPSWMTRVSGASHSFWTHPGTSTMKMGRKNADSLVGLPGSTQRGYSAAGTKVVDMKTLRFRKRPGLGHYSLFVKGFELDTITEVYSPAQGGAIPSQWVQAVDWHNAPTTAPPDAFWRTLVANRGPDGGNSPVYYSRACQETFQKGGLMSGSINILDLIKNEQCSVVAQFCRRVQEVIWNKALVKTGRGTFGLVGSNVQVGDNICILYGCSVPVVLRRSSTKKSDEKSEEIESEIKEDVRELFNKFRLKAQEHRKRVALFRQRRREEKQKDSIWEGEKRREWLQDQESRSSWKSLYLNKSWWELQETGREIKNRKREPGWYHNEAGWVEWTLKRSQEMEALKSIDKRELDLYHSLLQLRCPKSPWKVDEKWWWLWQRWRGHPLQPDFLQAQPSEQSKHICDKMIDFQWWRLKMAKLTVPEDREFNQWKAEYRVTRALQERWNEPSLNCGEFQLLLKYGRRWKRVWQKSKTAMQDDHYNLVYTCPFCRKTFSSKHYSRLRSHIMELHPSCELCSTTWVNEEDIEIHIHKMHPKVKLRKIITSISEYADSDNRGYQAYCDEQEAMRGDDDDDPLDPDYYIIHEFNYNEWEVKEAWDITRRRRLMEWMKKKHKDYYSPYSYEFLGECYVHGMMDGEAIAVQNNEELRTKIFELR